MRQRWLIPFTGGIIAILIVGVFIYIEWVLTTPHVLPAIQDGKLTETQQKSVDAILQYSGLMASWGLAIIASSAFLSQSLIMGANVTRSVYLLLVLTYVASFIAVFLSQAAINIMFRGLIAKQDFLENEYLFFAIRAQYFALAVAVMGFIILAVATLSQRGEHNK